MKNGKSLIAVFLAVLLLIWAPVALAEEDVLDTEKLDELLAIAASAKEENYTAETWQALVDAVAVANEAIASGSQLKVNNAVTVLATALSRLTSMDYADLDAIVQEAEQYIHLTFDGWMKLFKLMMEYHSVYGSGDQDAVNQAVQNIRRCLDELRENVVPPQITPEPQPSVPQDPQPVQTVTKSPVVWIILFSVSMLGNITFVVLMLLPGKNRKQYQVDEVPLVDYDIDDDVV